MSHGTTDACGPACDNLLIQKNGSQRHLFAMELAKDRDRKRAYYAAGYKAKAWGQASFVVLNNVDTWAAYTCHSSSYDQGVVDQGDQLREDAWRQARTNLFDLVTAQDHDPEAIDHLRTLFVHGVEVRDPETGKQTWREPTPKELRRAIDKAARIRLKRPEELPVELQLAIDEFSEDPSRGIIKYKIDRHKARDFFAKTTGMVVERRAISFEDAQAAQDRLAETFYAVLRREVPRLLADPQTWVPLALSQARAAAQKRLEASKEGASEDLERLSSAPVDLGEQVAPLALYEVAMAEVMG